MVLERVGQSGTAVFRNHFHALQQTFGQTAVFDLLDDHRADDRVFFGLLVGLVLLGRRSGMMATVLECESSI